MDNCTKSVFGRRRVADVLEGVIPASALTSAAHLSNKQVAARAENGLLAPLAVNKPTLVAGVTRLSPVEQLQVHTTTWHATLQPSIYVYSFACLSHVSTSCMLFMHNFDTRSPPTV